MWQYLMLIILATCSALETEETFLYDNYNGSPITEEDLMNYGNSSLCATEIKPCDPNEGRRLDGSCNNLNHPARGVARSPYISNYCPQILGKSFVNLGSLSTGFEPRLSESGAPMPLERHLRSALLATGNLPDLTFTQLATYFFVTMSLDIVSVEDSLKYAIEKTDCCFPKGKADSVCTPLKVPEDDPVFRYSNVRCLDLTRPISFQSTGCLRSGTTPERLVTSTPAFDLSELYGSVLKESLKVRLYSQGLLKYEVDDGRVFPPQSQATPSPCRLNEPPRETRCHDSPDNNINLSIGHNLMITWLWRNHNRIASTLADLNPCWDDERLFQTARDINIATTMQIFFYEFLPICLVREFLLRDSVISSDLGYRDMYDSNVLPQVSLEFPYVLRWGHLMLDGRLKMYDEEGKYLKQVPIVNLTLRTGYLAIDNNLDYITQGSFRQASGKIDNLVDPDIANRVFGDVNHVSDLYATDLARGRYFGFQPYIKYREYCSGRSHKTFDDLADLIDVEKLELLKDLYENVNDVDLMAGLWLENKIKGGWAPPTVYCVMVEQLLRSIKSDRHWYERPNRPNAFTPQQLQEIRKATISGFLCEVGDKVTSIQPSGFKRSGPGNEISSCSGIPKIDLTAWEDNTCAYQ